MILLLLVLIPIVGGGAAWVAGRSRPRLARTISLFALLVDLALALSSPNPAPLDWMWIPQWGVHFHLVMDGLSRLLVLLTLFLGLVSVAASWNENGNETGTGIREKVGLFHLNLLWVLAGITGVFLSFDLFLFYFFWELMLVPMYFLIAIWGHEKRTYAAMKFFLFTQASGLLMLLAILGIYFIHGHATGNYTFDWYALRETFRGTTTSATASTWLMLGFFAAFAVKLPVVPLHTWLPDAHTEAPTAGSVILAGLLLKTGAYGLLRFVLPLFPAAALRFSTIAMALGVVGILYGSILTFAQTDLKRMVAYTSVSHMGFVLLGVFSGNVLALQGAVIQILCHGLSTGALFVIVGGIQDRIGTREIAKMGGFWSSAPRMSSAGMFFALASLGLPGLGNFVGEFLVLLGTFKVSPLLAVLASLALIFSTIYSLWLVQAVFHGKEPKTIRAIPIGDFSAREVGIAGALMLALVWIGIYPQPVLNISRTPLAEVTHELH